MDAQTAVTIGSTARRPRTDNNTNTFFVGHFTLRSVSRFVDLIG